MELDTALAAQESCNMLDESDARAAAHAIDELEAFVAHEEAELMVLIQDEELHEPGLIPEVIVLDACDGDGAALEGAGTDEMMIDDSDDEWPAEFVRCACTLGPSRCTAHRSQGRRPCLMFSPHGWRCSGCVGCDPTAWGAGCRCW